MLTPRTIMAVVDPGADHQQALYCAARLAAETGAALHVQAIVYDPQQSDSLFHWGVEPPGIHEAAVARVQAWLENLLDSEGLKHANCQALWGHPFDEAISEAVQAHHPDLVVIQPRKPGGGRLSSSEWRLLSRCPVPVWLARSIRGFERPTVLAAVDPSHEAGKPESLDEQIVAWGVTVAGAFDGSLHLVHALGEIPSAIGVAQPPDEYERELRESRSRAIRALLPRDLEPPISLPLGEPAEVLQEAAEREGAGLVVMGILARSRLADLLIGSTAREFVPRSSCDVLLVKPT